MRQGRQLLVHLLALYVYTRIAASYLDQNQFMQKDSPPHVGYGYTCHNQESSDHESLTPGLEDKVFVRSKRAPAAIFSVGAPSMY